MSLELSLRFPDQDHVSVHLGGEDSGVLPFTNPLTPKDHQHIRWYLEVHGAHSLGNPDDADAARIQARLPVWGEALSNAVFQDCSDARPFHGGRSR